MKEKIYEIYARGRKRSRSVRKIHYGSSTGCYCAHLIYWGPEVESAHFWICFGMAAIVYTYFRIFSKNISKRYQENQKYLQMTDKLRARFQKEKRMMSQRKDYHIYSCPGCGQKIRIPRGGFKKVEIECPKCHTKFYKEALICLDIL